MFMQLLLCIVPVLFLGRREQLLRIVALQQQLAVYQRQLAGKRLQLTGGGCQSASEIDPPSASNTDPPWISKSRRPRPLDPSS